MTRAVGYVRVSRVGDRDTDSSSYRTEREQELSIRAAARELGAELVEIISERNVSGGSLSAGRQHALELIEAGAARLLIVAHTDRLARNVELDQQIRRRVKAAGAELVSVAERYDDSTPAGAAFSVVMAAFSAMYRDTRTESWRKAQRAALDDGVHVAGTPLGYTRPGKRQPLEVDQGRAELVVEAFKRRAAGESYAAIRRYLAEHGAVLKHDSDAANMLKCRTYLGEAAAGAAGRRPGAHPAIIDEALFGAAQLGRARFQTNGRLVEQVRLRGLVECATCGHRLRLGSSPSGRARYVCKGHGCGRPASCYADVLDRAVEYRIDVLGEPDELEPMYAADRYEQAAERVERAKAERRAYVLAMPATDPDYAAGLAVRDEAIQSAEIARDELSPHRSAGQTREQLVIERVVLEPGRAPAAERARIVWRSEK